MVDLRKLLLLSHELFNAVKAPHALIGAFGMSVYGYQRATNDIDFLVHGDFKTLVETEFLKNGFSVFYKTDEVLQLTGIGALDIIFANRDPSQSMLKQMNIPTILGVPCLLAEDIIGLKIQAFANNKSRKLRELADIQGLAEKKTDLDWEKIRNYADLFQVWDEIRSIREIVKR